MVTVVTVTNPSAFIVRKHLVARDEVLVKRYKLIAFSSFAYTQTTVCLYANIRSLIPNLKLKNYLKAFFYLKACNRKFFFVSLPRKYY